MCQCLNGVRARIGLLIDIPHSTAKWNSERQAIGPEHSALNAARVQVAVRMLSCRER